MTLRENICKKRTPFEFFFLRYNFSLDLSKQTFPEYSFIMLEPSQVQSVCVVPVKSQKKTEKFKKNEPS